jgi:hypothetical protein
MEFNDSKWPHARLAHHGLQNRLESEGQRFASRREVNGRRLAGCQNEMVRMSPQLDSGEVLAGLIERVTYHNAENGFCVLRAKAA